MPQLRLKDEFSSSVFSPQGTVSKVSIRRKIVKSLPAFIRTELPRRVIVAEISLQRSKLLNRIYRKINKSTNALSFRYGPDYGEILVCTEVIRREAKEQGNNFKYQMTWMILHGMLHLAGLHHERSPMVAEKVGRIEKRALRKLYAK